MVSRAFIPIIALFLIMSGHYAMFRLIRSLMKMESLIATVVSGTVMATLALSFLPAAILVRHFRTPVNQWIFIIAALWFGFFINSMLVLIGGGAIALAVHQVRNLSEYTTVLGVTWLAVAFVYTCYGFYGAEYPVVRHIPITLKQTPDHWKGKTIIHLSDIHLGNVHPNGFMDRLAEQVNALNPYVVVITGDLFDGLGGDIQELITSVNKLKAQKEVLVISGNHEGYNSRRVDIDKLMESLNHQVLNNSILDIDGVHFIGVKYPGLKGNDAYSKQFIEEIEQTTATQGPSVLLFHTPTDIVANFESIDVQQYKTYWAPDTSCSFNKKLGINLQLSGHTHAGQFHPFVWLTSFIYSGRHYGLHQEGDFHLYVSSGTGTFGPPMRTGCASEIVVFTLQ